MQEGPIAITLLSELDRLQALKQRQGQKFWRSNQQAERFSELNKTRMVMEQHYQEILDLEAGCTLSLTGLTQEPDSQVLEDWEQRYQGLKTRIYLCVHPEARRASLGLYGSRARITNTAGILSWCVRELYSRDSHRSIVR